jgi:hypothetical protein
MMTPKSQTKITDVIGKMPYRMALAGGWIDQPFVSQHNPSPPGSMVVVSLEPNCRFMDRSGMGTSTRKVAIDLWKGELPARDPESLIRELYRAENDQQLTPSGSQDMAGLIYPGINRLDYDFAHHGGYYPVHVETNTDPQVVRWLEDVFYMVPVVQRPPGYSPLGEQNLDPDWIRRLGQTGQNCFAAIIARDIDALGHSMNECMACWEMILPATVRHETISIDLMGIFDYYRCHYPGAMYSGCGGGYLYVVSNAPVPGGFQIKVRV